MMRPNFVPFHDEFESSQSILGLQPRDKAAMLVVNTKEIFLLNLHQNRVHFPAERNAFVLDHQHGRRDVTCKPAICHASAYAMHVHGVEIVQPNTIIHKSTQAGNLLYID